MLAKQLRVFCLILLFPIAARAQFPPSASGHTEPQWDTEKIATGIYWKAYHGDDFFDAKLSISLVEVWLDSAQADIKIGYSEEILQKTSEFGKQHEALAAINGSFFDMENAGSVVFIKSAGNIISRGAPANNFYTENGALSWNSGHFPPIIARPEAGWNSVHHEHENIFSSGPLLLLEGKMVTFRSDPFHQNRHPRTAVALTKDNRMIFLTVDGRSFQSYGMTIPELADFLNRIGATDALNFDGGGSTTLWISGKKEAGVVNYPSDNLEFDHLGERNVANVLLLLMNE